MFLFHVPLKIIEDFNLCTTEEYNQLNRDVKEWESECLPDAESKLQRAYYKAHKSVWLRLVTPFIYFFVLRWVNSLKNDVRVDTKFLD